jgi:hypothetical protein
MVGESGKSNVKALALCLQSGEGAHPLQTPVGFVAWVPACNMELGGF